MEVIIFVMQMKISEIVLLNFSKLINHQLYSTSYDKSLCLHYLHKFDLIQGENKPNGNPGMLPNNPPAPPAGGGAVLVLFVLESAEVVVVGVVEVDELVEVLAADVG